jgi:hypothetical protein
LLFHLQKKKKKLVVEGTSERREAMQRTDSTEKACRESERTKRKKEKQDGTNTAPAGLTIRHNEPPNDIQISIFRGMPFSKQKEKNLLHLFFRILREQSKGFMNCDGV